MPRRASSDSGDSPITLLTPAEAEAIARRVLSRLTTRKATVSVRNDTMTKALFTRNDIRNVAGDDRVYVDVLVDVDGFYASSRTTRTDPQGLDEFAASAESNAREGRALIDMNVYPPSPFKDPPLYFETTVAAAASMFQTALIRQCAEATEAAGLLGAGQVIAKAEGLSVLNTAGFVGHTRRTYGEVSVTARAKDGTSSGWAWSGREDSSRVDGAAVAARAIDLCKRSAKPLAVEPGRYTAILEPEAVDSIVRTIIDGNTGDMSSLLADEGMSVFSRPGGGNKKGMQMTDSRVDLFYDPSSDPADEELPITPLTASGLLRPRTPWLERGILRNLSYIDWYAKKKGEREVDNPIAARLNISGPHQSLDEMIATTKRGIWVHRLSGVALAAAHTLLLTGVTRDGTFLIENGKITKPIKNLRFSESPFFVLNKLDAFGPTVRASEAMAVPRLKVHDFEFTALTDAV